MNYKNKALQKHLYLRKLKRNWFLLGQAFLIGMGFGFIILSYLIVLASQ